MSPARETQATADAAACSHAAAHASEPHGDRIFVLAPPRDVLHRMAETDQPFDTEDTMERMMEGTNGDFGMPSGPSVGGDGAAAPRPRPKRRTAKRAPAKKKARAGKARTKAKGRAKASSRRRSGAGGKKKKAARRRR